MPKVARTCLFCGVGFESFPSQPRQYCSQSCRSRHRSAEFLPLKPRRGDTIPCDACGEPFYRGPGEIARDRRFCSVSCKDKGQSKGRIPKTCAACGDSFDVRPSRAEATYCSKRCESDGRVLRPLDRTHNGRPARLDTRGYVLVWEPDHPNKGFKGWMYEHRLVVEAVLGRYLETDEHVHHVNGVKDDNRPENLEVMAANDHAALSSRDYRDQVIRDRDELAEYRRRFGPLPDPNP